jgi:agmatinase
MAMLYTKKTFDYEYGLSEASVALLGIPWDSTETGKSVRYGPLFIREALRNIPGYDPVTGTNPFQEHKFCDLGDLEVVPGDWALTKERIQDTIREMFATNERVFPVFLGGDHLITLGILESLPHEKITVVHFDAHRDLLEDWMGNPHAHITWASHIVKNPRFELVQVGVRSWSKEEESLIARLKDTVQKTNNPI